MLKELFGTDKPVIGVVHLMPLPGSPRYSGDLETVLLRAEQEATALSSGGANGIIIENFFDAPFTKNRVDTATACAMTSGDQAHRDYLRLCPWASTSCATTASLPWLVAATAGSAVHPRQRTQWCHGH
jgi:hypothetical protein